MLKKRRDRPVLPTFRPNPSPINRLRHQSFGASLAVWPPIIAAQRGLIGIESPANLAVLGIFGQQPQQLPFASLLTVVASYGRSG